MTKFPISNIRTPRPMPLPERENDICASCRIVGCVFLPFDGRCIDRRSIYAQSDYENYDRIDPDDHFRELDRQELILTRKIADHGQLIYYKI